MGRLALLALGWLAFGCESGPRRAEAMPLAPTLSPAASDSSTAPSGVSTGASASSNAPAEGPRGRPRCARDADFPSLWRVPEASAAAEVSLRPGVRELLVVSDSGNQGQALLWSIPRGPSRPLTLALDPAASDDLEGAAWTGGHLYTLTSSGAVRRYSPDGKGGLARDQDAYPIGPPAYVCASLTDANCGANYEGLCLRGAKSTARCAGYAASKTTGKLVCVVFENDRIRVDPIKPPLSLDLPRHALSDCAFGAEGGPAQGTLLVTTNVYGGSMSYVVDEATGTLAPLDVAGLLNNEAIAADSDGALYQFMDSNTSPSLGSRATCEGWAGAVEARP